MVVITEAEVRYGMAKRGLSPVCRAAIEGLFTNLENLPWGSEEAALSALLAGLHSPVPAGGSLSANDRRL